MDFWFLIDTLSRSELFIDRNAGMHTPQCQSVQSFAFTLECAPSAVKFKETARRPAFWNSS